MKRETGGKIVMTICLAGLLLFSTATSILSSESVKAISSNTTTAERKLPELYEDNGDGFIVIGHRGAKAYYPENTMSSFKGAVKRGAEMLELDVQLSKDGVPVVFHDAKINRTTNGGSEFLSKFTLGELKQFDAGSWFNKKFAGERIPTLEEVLKFSKNRIALNIEIKTEAVTDEMYGGVEDKSLNLVKKYGMSKHVLFSSFDYRAVKHLKELDPEIPVAILYNWEQSGELMPSQLVYKYNADAFNCSRRELSKAWIEDLKNHEIPFFVYTVNQKRYMKSVIKKGARGIFTNKPDVLKKVASKLLSVE